MHKRWYDADPTVSLAISLIRNANQQTQVKCAEFIVDYAKQKGVTLKSNKLNDAFNYILRRWYDKDKTIAEAFEYFEASPFDIQKEISLDVINLLQLSELY
ncbi:MAG: hypothetical protein PHC64_10980 [Candidatus Gastranaerophilales bacterium]|nr:hypothetical protein [Candidatus Gastranaerophilales bacterium]